MEIMTIESNAYRLLVEKIEKITAYVEESRNREETERKRKEEAESPAILRQLEVDETKIRLFQVPMSRDRQEALCAYDRVCGEVLELVRSGKSVGITAEGDACFYSSAQIGRASCRERV